MTSIISECIAFLDRIRTKEGLKLEYYNSDILKSFAMYSTILSIIKQWTEAAWPIPPSPTTQKETRPMTVISPIQEIDWFLL